MDFHALPRRDLQALCKRNGVRANMTNVAMADALATLPSVDGIEAYVQQPIDAPAPTIKVAEEEKKEEEEERPKQGSPLPRGRRVTAKQVRDEEDAPELALGRRGTNRCARTARVDSKPASEPASKNSVEEKQENAPELGAGRRGPSRRTGAAPVVSKPAADKACKKAVAEEKQADKQEVKEDAPELGVGRRGPSRCARTEPLVSKPAADPASKNAMAEKEDAPELGVERRGTSRRARAAPVASKPAADAACKEAAAAEKPGDKEDALELGVGLRGPSRRALPAPAVSKLTAEPASKKAAAEEKEEENEKASATIGVPRGASRRAQPSPVVATPAAESACAVTGDEQRTKQGGLVPLGRRGITKPEEQKAPIIILDDDEEEEHVPEGDEKDDRAPALESRRGASRRARPAPAEVSQEDVAVEAVPARPTRQRRLTTKAAAAAEAKVPRRPTKRAAAMNAETEEKEEEQQQGAIYDAEHVPSLVSDGIVDTPEELQTELLLELPNQEEKGEILEQVECADSGIEIQVNMEVVAAAEEKVPCSEKEGNQEEESQVAKPVTISDAGNDEKAAGPLIGELNKMEDEPSQDEEPVSFLMSDEGVDPPEECQNELIELPNQEDNVEILEQVENVRSSEEIQVAMDAAVTSEVTVSCMEKTVVSAANTEKEAKQEKELQVTISDSEAVLAPVSDEENVGKATDPLNAEPNVVDESTEDEEPLSSLVFETVCPHEELQNELIELSSQEEILEQVECVGSGEEIQVATEPEAVAAAEARTLCRATAAAANSEKEGKEEEVLQDAKRTLSPISLSATFFDPDEGAPSDAADVPALVSDESVGHQEELQDMIDLQVQEEKEIAIEEYQVVDEEQATLITFKSPQRPVTPDWNIEEDNFKIDPVQAGKHEVITVDNVSGKEDKDASSVSGDLAPDFNIAGGSSSSDHHSSPPYSHVVADFTESLSKSIMIGVKMPGSDVVEKMAVITDKMPERAVTLDWGIKGENLEIKSVQSGEHHKMTGMGDEDANHVTYNLSLNFNTVGDSIDHITSPLYSSNVVDVAQSDSTIIVEEDAVTADEMLQISATEDLAIKECNFELAFIQADNNNELITVDSISEDGKADSCHNQTSLLYGPVLEDITESLSESNTKVSDSDAVEKKAVITDEMLQRDVTQYWDFKEHDFEVESVQVDEQNEMITFDSVGEATGTGDEDASLVSSDITVEFNTTGNCSGPMNSPSKLADVTKPLSKSIINQEPILSGDEDVSVHMHKSSSEKNVTGPLAVEDVKEVSKNSTNLLDKSLGQLRAMLKTGLMAKERKEAKKRAALVRVDEDVCRSKAQEIKEVKSVSLPRVEASVCRSRAHKKKEVKRVALARMDENVCRSGAQEMHNKKAERVPLAEPNLLNLPE